MYGPGHQKMQRSGAGNGGEITAQKHCSNKPQFHNIADTGF